MGIQGSSLRVHLRTYVTSLAPIDPDIVKAWVDILLLAFRV